MCQTHTPEGHKEIQCPCGALIDQMRNKSCPRCNRRQCPSCKCYNTERYKTTNTDGWSDNELEYYHCKDCGASWTDWI
ncbi:MAG: hypothetical protein PHT54_01375 [Candidatus Nanoarchaeia archaeon]|nr:hypothetical protein [Candidatus Nanoarchaeia archaeon]